MPTEQVQQALVGHLSALCAPSNVSLAYVCGAPKAPCVPSVPGSVLMTASVLNPTREALLGVDTGFLATPAAACLAGHFTDAFQAAAAQNAQGSSAPRGKATKSAVLLAVLAAASAVVLYGYNTRFARAACVGDGKAVRAAQ